MTHSNAVPSPTADSWRHTVEKHPYLFSAVLIACVPLTTLLGQYVEQHLLGIGSDVFSIGGAIVRAGGAIVIIAGLNWWCQCGFTSKSRWRQPYLYLVLVIPLASPLLSLGHPKITEPLILLSLLGGALLVGFNEEALSRGLILTAFLPRGLRRAALLSAAFFALGHVPALFFGRSPAYTALQLMFAFGLGTLFAALRIRTNAIWPLILAHAANDWMAVITFGPGVTSQPVTLGLVAFAATFGLLLVGIGLFLLRPPQVPVAAPDRIDVTRR